jgi:hypothetical protein
VSVAALGRTGESFKDFVDRDIRGHTTQAEAEALRSPALAERWLTTLTMMQRSIEGQLAAKQEEFQAERARLRRERRRLTDPDQIDRTDDVLDRLQENHSRDRAKKLRFKTGLDEALVEARAVVDALRGHKYDSLVADERNYYAEQRRLLEEAIRLHQAQMLAEGIEPGEHDEKLWEALT